MRIRLFVLLLPLVLSAQIELTARFARMVSSPANRAVVWAATAQTIYRSVDEGRSYTAVRWSGRREDQGKVLALHVDRRNSDVIHVLVQSPGNWLFRSRDGGQTWQALTAGLPEVLSGNPDLPASVQQPSDQPQNLYVQVGVEVYKSVDGGDSFRRQTTLPRSGALWIAPSDHRVFYATSDGVTSGLAVSNDEGATWTRAGNLSQGAITQAILSGGPTLVVHPREANRLFGHFFLTLNDPNSATGRSVTTAIYQSRDGGRTWVYNATQAGFLRNLTVSEDGSLLLVAGPGLRSADFGDSFSRVPSSGEFEYYIHRADAQRVYTSTHLVSSDGARSFTQTRPTYRLLPALVTPLELELERETAVSLSAAARDTDGGVPRLTDAVAQPGAAWLKTESLPGAAAFQYEASAKGLGVGVYEGSYELRSAALVEPFRLGIRLRVVEKRAPQVRFRVRRLAKLDTPVNDLSLAGNLVTAATDQAVVQWNAAGVPRTIAGGREGRNGAGDGGNPTQAGFGYLGSLDTAGRTMLVSDSVDGRIRQFEPEGTISTLFQARSGVTPSFVGFRSRIRRNAAGEMYLNVGTQMYRWDGNRFQSLLTGTGNPSLADFRFEGTGSVVAATASQVFRFRPGLETPRVIAGSGEEGFAGDHGPAEAARFNSIFALSAGPDGTLYVVENRRVRAIWPGGVVQTVAGDGTGMANLRDGELATEGSLGDVTAIAADGQGRVYVGAFDGAVYVLEPVAGEVPRIANGGVVSLAAGARRIAPGAIFSIYGEELASATGANTTVPLPTQLLGTEVRVNGARAPLFFVSPGQVNAQMPYDAGPGAVRVTVVREGRTSGEQTVEVAESQPDILTYGSNRAVAVNPDGAVNGVDRGAAQGEVVVVYLTGLGRVDASVAAGQAAPGSPLARPLLAGSARVGGQAAQLLYLGLTPGFVGMGQANVVVPGGVAPGDAELTLVIGSRESNRPLLRIR